MSLFGSIMDKIFRHAPSSKAAPPMPAPSAPAQAPSAAGTAALRASPAATPPATQAPATAAAPVDVEAVLTQMAGAAGGGGNWRTSIVDLLKLLDLDSSLAARKELGAELGVHAGADGTAEQNIALHKAVMAKLAANGGKVPASLKD